MRLDDVAIDRVSKHRRKCLDRLTSWHKVIKQIENRPPERRGPNVGPDDVTASESGIRRRTTSGQRDGRAW